MTPEQLAKAYAETIYGPANAWGQHVHPTLGISHGILRVIYGRVGHAHGEVLVRAAMSAKAREIKEANRVHAKGSE